MTFSSGVVKEYKMDSVVVLDSAKIDGKLTSFIVERGAPGARGGVR